MSFIHNVCPIVLKFCTEHGIHTAVLWAKFLDDCIIDKDNMDEREFARLDLKMSFGRISYIAQQPWLTAGSHNALRNSFGRHHQKVKWVQLRDDV